MKKLFPLNLLLVFAVAVHAQDVDYKKGMIQVDGKDYAKLEVKKENFGLTKSFEVFSLSGKKLIIAAVATEFEQDKKDNTYLFYRLTFLTSNQVGILKVPSLSQEKGFAKLIGGSGIIAGDSTLESKVKEFIAYKGASPRMAIDYTMVARDRAWPIHLKDDKNFEQQSQIIGSFRPTNSYNGQDYYEFLLPSGVVIAKVSFTGGNNAQNMEIFTAKDNHKRVVPMPQEQKIIAASAGIDKNQMTIQRIGKWLVENRYM